MWIRHWELEIQYCVQSLGQLNRGEPSYQISSPWPLGLSVVVVLGSGCCRKPWVPEYSVTCHRSVLEAPHNSPVTPRRTSYNTLVALCHTLVAQVKSLARTLPVQRIAFVAEVHPLMILHIREVQASVHSQSPCLVRERFHEAFLVPVAQNHLNLGFHPSQAPVGYSKPSRIAGSISFCKRKIPQRVQ